MICWNFTSSTGKLEMPWHRVFSNVFGLLRAHCSIVPAVIQAGKLIGSILLNTKRRAWAYYLKLLACTVKFGYKAATEIFVRDIQVWFAIVLGLEMNKIWKEIKTFYETCIYDYKWGSVQTFCLYRKLNSIENLIPSWVGWNETATKLLFYKSHHCYVYLTND